LENSIFPRRNRYVFDQKRNAGDIYPRPNFHEGLLMMDDETKTEDRNLKSRRAFRRLRWQFKKDIGTLTRADRVLIDQASLLALRAQMMRDAILSGESVSDEDLVRTSNAAMRAMAAIDRRKDRAASDAKPQTFEERMKARDRIARREFNEDDF
jgi:hypothetical protein